MAFDLSAARADDTAVSEGVWEEWLDEAYLLIASSENPKYKAYLSKSARANRVKLEGDPTVSTVQMTKAVTCRGMADFILLDWKGVESDGQPVPYSKETAYQSLMQVPALFDFVLEKANQHSRFTREAVSSLKEPSNGTSETAATVSS